MAAALAVAVGAVLVLIRLGGLASRDPRGLAPGAGGPDPAPGGAVLQVAGFGLGILALLLLAVVRVDLLRAWQESLPRGHPTVS